jgi:hypothetical protein
MRASAASCRCLTGLAGNPTAARLTGIAPSSNGKTTDSDSVNRGSNPRGASSTPNYPPGRLALKISPCPSSLKSTNSRRGSVVTLVEFQGRRETREPVEMMARFRHGISTVTVMLKDITPHGARVEGVGPLETDDAVFLMLVERPERGAGICRGARSACLREACRRLRAQVRGCYQGGLKAGTGPFRTESSPRHLLELGQALGNLVERLPVAGEQRQLRAFELRRIVHRADLDHHRGETR